MPPLSRSAQDGQEKDFHLSCQDKQMKTNTTASRQRLEQGNDTSWPLVSVMNKGQDKSFHSGHEVVFQSTP